MTAYVAAGAGQVVLQAAAITAVVTTGLSVYGLTTRRDFSGLAPALVEAWERADDLREPLVAAAAAQVASGHAAYARIKSFVRANDD